MTSFGKRNGAVDFKQNKSRFCVNFNISFQMWKSWRLDTTAMPLPRRRLGPGGEIGLGRLWAVSQLANLLGSKTKLGLLIYFILIWSSFSTVLGSKCSERGRVIVNGSFGYISEGVDQLPVGYKEGDHCEWLIKAADPGAYIVLQFSSFETECSYDFLFVYDGGSYQSPLLASLSGDTLPMPVIARSGMMLIYLYSDTNYVLAGFHASFIVEDCIFNCSGNGECLNHTCMCNDGYTGEACQFKACPNECGSSQGRGVCKVNNDGFNHCHCYDGYIGDDCSLSTTDNLGWGSTFTISNTSTFARTAHGGVFDSKTNALWMYGGFDMDKELDDIVIFNFTSNEWQVITPNSNIQPVGRRSHSVVLYQDELIVFGGLLNNGSYSNELWSFDISTLEWQLLDAGSDSIPVPRADHSASIVEYSALYIFGGHSVDENFLGDLYKYDLVLRIGWTLIQPLGGLEYDVRVSAHSSVYHYDSKSLIIFGGFRPKWLKATARTNETYAFHIEKLYWMEWENSVKRAPRERAFHTAVIMGNYMVVYGGNVHIFIKKNKNFKFYEKCYEDQVSFYHLGCHRWLTDEEISQDFRSDASNHTHLHPRGRFGHIAAVRDGNILLIAGGFSGTVMNDIIAIKVPGSVATNSASHHPGECNTYCHMHTRLVSCNLDPDCGWCYHTEEDNSPACLPHSQQKMCASTFHQSDCPGICDVLTTCESCTIWGQGTGPITYAPAGVRLNEKCGWCVQDGICTRINEKSGFCRDMTNSTSPVGWWGRNGDFLTNFEECRKYDIPPGLTWMKYTAPYNLSHPDEVEIIRSSSHHFIFNKIQKYGKKTPIYSIAMLKGFIFPNEAQPPQGSRLRVWLGSNQDNTSLIISESPQKNKALKIQPAEAEGVRTDSSDIFPNVLRGVKYYLELQIKTRVNEEGRYSKYFSLELEWNGNLDNSRDISKILTEEYLQPFSSSDCSSYTNCKACLSDSSCGWCPTSLTCELRNGPLLPSIRCGILTNPNHHLVVDLMMCVDCNFYISCLSCTQDRSCEWLSNGSMCNRRGINLNAFTLPNECSDPCIMSSSCSSCTNNPDCGWCEEINHCFVYGTYTLLFPFGQCSHWFEEPSQCIDCSKFTSCVRCLSHFQCGWCTDPNNHSIGSCLEGSFEGPLNSECTYSSDPVTNITLPAIWDYQECFLCERIKHNCSENATCIDDHLGFTCRCNIGFHGDGVNCKRKCTAPCVHGQCRESFNFDECDCDIGWTGSTCDIDCGCNERSTCLEGVDRCDQCQHNTTGKKCDACLPGFYAKSDPSFTCEPCSCNGHGDPTKGLCDPSDGVCFCKGQTMGNNCERCLGELHGDPRNGGSCYIPCNGRTLLTNISSGGISSSQPTLSRLWTEHHCLWVLTVFESIQEVTQPLAVPSISFTIDQDINIDCGFEFVTVYDGMPTVVSGHTKNNSKLLGRFCGKGLERQLTVTAYSGIITVSFDARQAAYRDTYGFKALFQVNSCPKSCYGNRECVKGECICREGYKGNLCEMMICPSNCSNHGICNKTIGLCICEDGFGGVSCNQAIDHNTVVWTTIFDIERLQNSLICGQDYPCGRSGHSMLHSSDGNLLIFGGFSMEHGFLNDVWNFNTSSREWRKEQSQYRTPMPRSHHAACYLPSSNKMVIVGGQASSQIFRDIWLFSVETKLWEEIRIDEEIDHRQIDHRPPAVAGHTLTRIGGSSPESDYLLLIGGYSPDNGLMNATWKYPYPLGNRPWIQVDTTGISPTGIYGHSSVYDENTQAVYVFGGYTFHVNKTQISDLLYVLHIPTEHWSILPNEDSISAHVFHSAVSVQNHMIILGGSNDKFGFTSSMLAYRYMCNQWLNLSEYSVGDQPFISKDIATVAIGNRIYVYGGQTGISYGAVHVLDLPRDLCSLETTKDGCYKRPGCSACEDPRNKIHCFNSELGREPESCQSGMHTYGGVLCNQVRLQQRNCSLTSSCAECVAKYPAFPNTNQTCKWCSYCPKGECINIHDQCDRKLLCKVDHPILKDKDCPEYFCAASTCSNCRDMNCLWTNRVQWKSEVKKYMSLSGEYAWNCYHDQVFASAPEAIQKEPTPIQYRSSCPEPCNKHKSCQLCLESPGADSGWDGCIWSTRLNLCMSPTYVQLHCINGLCGKILNSDSITCPYKDPCIGKEICGHCLQESGCGWCANPNTNGFGVCMKGAINGADGVGQCSRLSNHKDASPTGQPDGEWHYFKCPQEDECENDHHGCWPCEKCDDRPENYVCACKPGYSCTNECIPQCDPPCKKGKGECVGVDKCKCKFGFVGNDCGVECKCNGHSDCYSVDQLSNCTSCQHNTTGATCEYCLPNFVFVDFPNGRKCHHCRDYCNGNSDTCISKENYDYPEIKSNHGPSKNSVCLNCKNNTQGNRCEECRPGYFKPDNICIKCICNGNCDTCHQQTGHVDPNACRNNTTTDHEPETNLQKQCAKCKDGFVGSPKQGRPCYRSLACLPKPKDYASHDCDSVAVELAQGRTSFFHIEGKMDLFLLSDIQVSHGMFDIFIASNEYLLMAVTNKTSGVQMIHINDSVRINSNEVEIKTRRSTKVIHLKSDSSFDRAYYNTSVADKKRSVDNNAVNKSAIYKTEDVFKFYETTADGVNNFLYITFSRFAVKINDVRDRLVVHFQHKRLTNPKYFIAFVSKGDDEYRSTMALIKLSKLSKAHIDLFVFFSVFFSSFFILLSLCVLIWKVKLWRDNRLRFRRQTMEMESRRSRPFGVVFVMIDQKRTRHQRKSRHGHRNRGEAQQMPTHPNKQPPSFITLEPTFDDLATVCTVLMTLPGGDVAPSRGCLGSALFSFRPPPPKIQDSRQKNAEEIKPRLATYYSRMRQGAVARGRTQGPPPPPPPEWL